jgi:hypothetical protein
MLLYFLGFLISFYFSYTIFRLIIGSSINGLIEELVVLFIFTPAILYFAIDAYYVRYVIINKNIVIKKFMRNDEVYRDFTYIEEKIIMGPLKYFEIYFDGLISMKIPNVDDEAAFVSCLGIDHVKRTRLW